MRLLLIPVAVVMVSCTDRETGSPDMDSGVVSGDTGIVDGTQRRCDEDTCDFRSTGERLVCVYDNACIDNALPACTDSGFLSCLTPNAHLECVESDSVHGVVGDEVDDCEPSRFCDQVSRLECDRAFLRGDYSEDERGECISMVPDFCASYTYPGEAPTSQDCVDLLMEPDSIDTPICSIQDCAPYWHECNHE